MGSSIKEILVKIKTSSREFLADTELFSALLIITVGIASYGLGRLSVAPEQTSAASAPQMHMIDATTQQTTTAVAGNTERTEEREVSEATIGQFVASKNSDKYHLPWCSGAQRISEENKIWFATKAEAEEAGYEPAANCKGI